MDFQYFHEHQLQAADPLRLTFLVASILAVVISIVRRVLCGRAHSGGGAVRERDEGDEPMRETTTTRECFCVSSSSGRRPEHFAGSSYYHNHFGTHVQVIYDVTVGSLRGPQVTRAQPAAI